MLQSVAVRGSVLQSVAVCGSVLQRVVVCCKREGVDISGEEKQDPENLLVNKLVFLSKY